MQENSHHSLKQGGLIKNFEIIRVLGSGGFGITYLAKDTNLDLEVVIKEYFPNEFAVRKSDSTIIAKTSSDRDYAKGKLRFKEEAQILAKFNHPSIVKILGYFEANSTAYFVMEYEEGIDLAQYMKQKGKPFSQEEILTIMMPILEGLKEVHKYNYLHRDIKPGNILLKKNSSPVLIDFGATRIAVNDEQSKSVTSMLTEGYAPFEQYSTDLKRQGAFTDLYSIGAVMYKMITLETPIASQTRSFQLLQDEDDPLVKLSAMKLKGYDSYFLNAIDKALESKPNKRQKNVEELQAELARESRVDSSINDEKLVSGKNYAAEDTEGAVSKFKRKYPSDDKFVSNKKISFKQGSEYNELFGYLFFFLLLIALLGVFLGINSEKSQMGEGTGHNAATLENKTGATQSNENYDRSKCSAYTVVNAQQLNVRDKPAKLSNIVGRFKRGDKVCVYEFSENWGRIDQGWISGKYLKALSQKNAQKEETPKFTIAVGNLMWQDMPEDTTKNLNWNEAKSYCQNLTLGGYDDWRLPEVDKLKELYTHGPKLKYNSFSQHWSSTAGGYFASDAWAVYSNYGSSKKYPKTSSFHVRCMRDKQ